MDKVRHSGLNQADLAKYDPKQVYSFYNEDEVLVWNELNRRADLHDANIVKLKAKIEVERKRLADVNSYIDLCQRRRQREYQKLSLSLLNNLNFPVSFLEPTFWNLKNEI